MKEVGAVTNTDITRLELLFWTASEFAVSRWHRQSRSRYSRW
jgi:hypothetical protein